MAALRGLSWWAKGPLILLLFALLLLAALAAFPWGMLRETIEARLTKRLGRQAHIAVLERMDSFSLHPTVIARDISIPQPQWADAGNLAQAEEARVTFNALSLLTGRFDAEAFDVSGMTVHLIRDKAGRESWNDGEKDERDSSTRRPRFNRLRIVNSRVIYEDAKRDRSMDLKVEADVRRGLTMRGTGLIKGHPVAVAIDGAAVAGEAADRPWPFRAEIKGDAVGATFKGTMDRPLDIGHLTASATAYGRDLALVDVIIEAGLPATQPVRLAAQVRRDRPDWTITRLRGTIGRSDIAGNATIRKRDGRTRIEGEIRSRQFDFDDLASDEGLARGRAERRASGPRVVPGTAIELKSVSRTDGRLDLRVDRILWPAPSPFRSMQTTLVLERGKLTLDPLVIGLSRGTLAGLLVVDQQAGDGMAPAPLLTIRMDMRDAHLVDFFPHAGIDGELSARLRIAGRGDTVRQAIAASNGMIALVARDGTIPARTASLLGQDIGRGLLTGKGEQAQLRCIIARLDVRSGIASVNPALIDTTRALTRATGSVSLRTEAMDFALNGAPKGRSVLRFTGSVPVRGTMKLPQIIVPKDTASFGNVMKMIGRAIAGKQGTVAQDIDCAAMQAQAMR